jgi:transposase
MASIIKKVKKGRPYYYAVESARVNGKPRIVWQKYLGTVDAIVARAADARPAEPAEAVIFELGGVAALLGIAQRLNLTELIDEVVPKREQGPSVGQYMVLAALNRALSPCSKMAIGDWYEGTVLRRLWAYPKKAFSSQRFWDHMGMVSEEAIRQVEERLLERISSEFGLDGSLLLYDTTNFFTFLATTNDRAKLPQRGHSKAKRHDLRQVGLALMVTKEFQVPLLHKVYEGNVPDVTLFPEISIDLIDRYKKLTGAASEATLVFDRTLRDNPHP